MNGWTGTHFRVKRKRGGARSTNVAAARDAWSAKCTNAWLDVLASQEPAQQQPDPLPFKEPGKTRLTAPLARAFMLTYATYADQGSRLPSDMVAVRAGIIRARALGLPPWYAPAIVLVKYGPCVEWMVDCMAYGFGGLTRPPWNKLSDNADFLVACAIEVRRRYIEAEAGSEELGHWKASYHCANGKMGPHAVGPEFVQKGEKKGQPSPIRAGYAANMGSLAKDRDLHRLMSELQDGQVGLGSLQAISEKLKAIWTSPYVGDWVVRTTLWCSCSCEDTASLEQETRMFDYSATSSPLLCAKPTNQHITPLEARRAFKRSSPFLLAMHLCFAESMQELLKAKVPGVRTSQGAAEWLESKVGLRALKAAYARTKRRAGLEPHPRVVVGALEFT